jgi:hypothetical protein
VLHVGLVRAYIRDVDMKRNYTFRGNRMNRTLSKMMATLCGVGSLLACGGCASMISGRTQQVAFDSNPSQADVFVNGSKYGTTPCVLTLQRSKMLPKVELKKDGYADANVPVLTRFNYVMALDLFWGLIGVTTFAVELGGESSVEYDPNRYFTVLEPLENRQSVESAQKQEAVKETSKLLRYIAVNYGQIITDISSGGGDHLLALYNLLDIAEDKRPVALETLKKLYIEYGDAMTFGRAVDVSFPRSSQSGTVSTPLDTTKP